MTALPGRCAISLACLVPSRPVCTSIRLILETLIRVTILLAPTNRYIGDAFARKNTKLSFIYFFFPFLPFLHPAPQCSASARFRS